MVENASPARRHAAAFSDARHRCRAEHSWFYDAQLTFICADMIQCFSMPSRDEKPFTRGVEAIANYALRLPVSRAPRRKLHA